MIRSLRRFLGTAWGAKKQVALRLRRPALSFLVDLRAVAVIVLIGLVTLAAMIVNVGIGEYPISPPDVVRTILGIEVEDGSYDFIVNTLRLPRVIVALLVGVGLGISGAILQGLTQNDLAAPDIIGVNAGASLAAVTLIVAVPSVPVAFLPPVAFGGAFVVAVLLYLLAWKGRSSPMRLILNRHRAWGHGLGPDYGDNHLRRHPTGKPGPHLAYWQRLRTWLGPHLVPLTLASRLRPDCFPLRKALERP
jgi:hypothetical protein